MSETDEPLLLFLHIPKTAGATLRQVLMEQWPGQAIDIYGPRWDEPDLSKLGRLSATERQTLRAIFGHFGYGVHEAIDRPARYLTLLRDPVARLISQYCYIRRDNPRRLGHMTLADFAAGNVVPPNIQTRMLAANLGEIPEAGKEALALAKRRLRDFAFVGVTDRFDESLLIMARKFGWRLPFYARQHENPIHVRIDDLPDALVAEIARRNAFDVELHRWASERLEDQALALGLRFRAELAAFRAVNRRGGAWFSAQQRRLRRNLVKLSAWTSRVQIRHVERSHHD